MKIKVILLTYIILLTNTIVILQSCGQNYSTEETTTSPPETMLEDMSGKEDRPDPYADWKNNHGIGPVDSLAFEEGIDSLMVQRGKTAFEKQCIYCHKESEDFIGPPMKGIFEKRTPAWTMNMILNPEEMVIRDPMARQLYEDYNYSPMQKQVMDVEEARAMLEYFRTL
jgi:mono/diheme cytochrome c family protein